MISSPFIIKAQENFTLQKAIELAIDKNIHIKTSMLNEAVDEVNLTQAHNNKLPNLFSNDQGFAYYGRSIDPSTNLFINSNILGSNESIASQVTVYQGGLLKNQILENELLLNVDKTNTTKIKNDIVLNVVITYLQILANQDILKAAVQQVDIVKQTLVKLQQNIEIGNNKKTDLTQMQAQLANADLIQTKAEGQLDMSVLALKQLMEMNPATAIVFEKPDIDKLTNIKTLYDAQDVIKAAEGVSPDVHVADAYQQAANQNIAVVKSGYYPTVTLFAGINSNYSSALQRLEGQTTTTVPIGYLSGNPNQLVLAPYTQPLYGRYPFTAQLKDNLNEAIGFVVQIPIFSRFNNNSALKKARLNYQIATYNTQVAKDNLNKTINQAILDLHTADKNYIATQLTYQTSKDAYAIVQERFALGQLNQIDYDTALNNLNKAEFDNIHARYELVFRSKLIEYYQGVPIEL